MNLFKKLFSKTAPVVTNGGQLDINPQQFIATSYIQDLLKKHVKSSIALKPQLSKQPLDTDISKMGGEGDLTGFDFYPCCDSCGSPLNFILQLYKRDFPEHYYPADKDLFQVFRCPNYKCSAACTLEYDLKTFVYYFNAKRLVNQVVSRPNANLSDVELQLPDIELRPKKINDYPNYEDYGDDLNTMEKLYGEKLTNYFYEHYQAIFETKIGGYPSFTQGSHYPICLCGKPKEFFFQLASETFENNENNFDDKQSATYMIMIGDSGNVYFYVCRDCGENSVETYWDCF